MGRLARAVGAVSLLTLATCNDSSAPTTTSRDGNPGTSPQLATAAVPWPGAWAPAPGWPARVAVHAHLLPDGQVLFWSGEEAAGKGHKTVQEAFIWNPATGASLAVPNTRTDVFCSGHAFLPDGSLLVVGGHIEIDFGLRDANIFDFQRRKWFKAAPMAAGRWYPSAVTMPSGEVLVIGGGDENGIHNELPEVWKTRGGWRPLTGARRRVDYYARIFALSDGRAYYAGPGRNTLFLDVNGTGSLADGPTRQLERDYGSAVMYAPDRILYVGGGEHPPTATAEVIDLRQSGATWQPTGSMAHARRQMNATLLADGTVLATGGTSSPTFNDATGAVLAPELWDPATGTWTELAPMSEPRLYHSTALLLPDGRVLSAGGGRPPAYNDPAGDHPTADIFTPPYLFTASGQLAVRPTISSAPTSVEYDQTFTVGTPDAASIQKVTWIRTSSVTHAHNMDQRISFPAFSVSGTSLRVTAPPRGDAPPGYYMLFIIDGNGVPSVAKLIRIG